MAEKKINAVKMGLAFGIAFAVYALILGLMAAYLNWGNAVVDLIGAVYLGYKATLLGSLIGAVWAFVDCFVGFTIVFWLYNKLL